MSIEIFWDLFLRIEVRFSLFSWKQYSFGVFWSSSSMCREIMLYTFRNEKVSWSSRIGTELKSDAE